MARELNALRDIIGPKAHTFDDIYTRLDPMLGDASVVLLGEATHGTHEFYSLRAELTKRLIVERGFNAVAVEADWPDAYRINKFVRNAGTDATSEEALGGFHRFPVWMWRNEVVSDFVTWLRDYNAGHPVRDGIGFYGIDLYSLAASVAAVLGYLEQVDPEAAARAKDRYACFEMFLGNPHAYGHATAIGAVEGCEREALKQLIELRAKSFEYLQRNGLVAQDEQFSAEQNAVVIKNAEAYYRAMFDDDQDSWNLRDTHMFQTLRALESHLSKQRGAAKLIVWEHNSHIGDARATQTSRPSQLNVGQLVREYYGERCRLIGFTTYSGTVTAASNWGEACETKVVRRGLQGSYEDLFHQTGVPQFVLSFRSNPKIRKVLAEPRLERAIGVIYRPETERHSHYFLADMPAQFDAVIHVDESTAVRPLEREVPLPEEMPETYPSGF